MRSSILCRVAILLLCGLAPSTSWSAGTHNFEFLRVGIAPQPAAMGGAFVALSDGMVALDGNVAGLSLIPNSEAMAAYMRYPQDVQAGWVAVGRTVPSGWRFGFGVKYLSYGSMVRTTVTDPAGQHSDSFSASDVAIKFGAAYGVADRLRAGLAATYVSGTIDSYKAGAAGLADVVPPLQLKAPELVEVEVIGLERGERGLDVATHGVGVRLILDEAFG